MSAQSTPTALGTSGPPATTVAPGPSAAGGPVEGQPIVFTCVYGPDAGRQLPVGEKELILGRAGDCQIISGDMAVSPQHLGLCLKGGKLHCRAVAPATALVLVDDCPWTDGPIEPGQQVRIGASVWAIAEDRGAGFIGLLGRFSDHLATAAGMEKVRGFNARTTFADVFKRHTHEEIEQYLAAGTPGSTPDLLAIDTSWPKPWLFVRMFFLGVGVYLLFVLGLHQFENLKLLPGLIIVGSFAVPFAMLILFFEVNVARNVSLYQVIRLVALGGAVSLLVALIGFKLSSGALGWLGAMSAGIVEELGKAATLFLVVRNLRYRWILNGLLFGAIVGTGFAAFESAGYAFNSLISKDGVEGMEHSILLRGVLCILSGHILWTGMVGAALWRVRGDRPFSFEMLQDFRFLRVLFLAMALHMLWNSPIELPMFGKYVLLAFPTWAVILSIIQSGLKQIKTEQKKVREASGAVAAVAAAPVPATAAAGAVR
jgi:RsiW-degrading membrane proteinase PrsW (M82 family)